MSTKRCLGSWRKAGWVGCCLLVTALTAAISTVPNWVVVLELTSGGTWLLTDSIGAYLDEKGTR